MSDIKVGQEVFVLCVDVDEYCQHIQAYAYSTSFSFDSFIVEEVNINGTVLVQNKKDKSKTFLDLKMVLTKEDKQVFESLNKVWKKYLSK